MSTFAGKGITVSSWGWLDADGQRAKRDGAVHRLWSITDDGERRGFIALPVDTDGYSVLNAADRALEAGDIPRV